MKRFHFIITLCTLFSSIATCDASDSLIVRIKNNVSPLTGFTGFTALNLSSMLHIRYSDLTEFGIDYHGNSGEAALLQEGTRKNEYKLYVNTLQHLQDSPVWGSVSYRKGHKDNVRWNESADYLLIYPYVINDTVGGDNLQMEEYSFSGGFARNMGQWEYGVEMDYRALKEYRTLDPRPDNTVSDLFLKGGVSLKLLPGHTIGGAAYYRKYKQRNTLSFYSDLGAPWIYHDTGLGTNAYMFSGVNNNAMLDGHGYGMNLQLLPDHFFGLTATIAYDNFSYEKQLGNESYLPLSEINEDQFSAFMAYTKKNGHRPWGIKLSASHRNRKGTEHLYNLSASRSYDLISSPEMYGHKVNSAELTLLFGADNKNGLSWHISPSATYTDSKESYRNPQREMDFSSISEGVTGHLSVYTGKLLLSAEAGIHAAQIINEKLILTGLQENSYTSRILKQNHAYLSSNNMTYHANVRGDYPVSDGIALFFKAGALYASHDNGLDRSEINISAGVCF